MISASDLARLEGHRIEQINYFQDHDEVQIVIADCFDEYGNEVDRTLSIHINKEGIFLELRIW